MISKLFSKIPRQRGFSLIELMITIGIVVLVTGLALLRYSGFNNAVLLKSQAYELALDIRQAQVYGISVSGQNAANFSGAYGISFNMATPGTYQLFQDGTTGNQYRYDSGEGVGNTYVIDPRFVISQICTSGGNCLPGNGIAAVAFQRPNFDAHIYKSNQASPSNLEITIASVSSPTNTRKVVVYASGQIAVQ